MPVAIEVEIAGCIGVKGEAREADVVRVRGMLSRPTLDGHVDVVARAGALAARATVACGEVVVVLGAVARALRGRGWARSGMECAAGRRT